MLLLFAVLRGRAECFLEHNVNARKHTRMPVLAAAAAVRSPACRALGTDGILAT